MTREIPPVVPILLELLEIPSPTGEESAICDHVARLVADAADHGQPLTWQRSGHNLVVHGPPEPGRPRIVLVGHLDTVPIAEGLEPRLDDTRLVGRGAVDMKAGVAVMIGLLEGLDLRASRADLSWVFYDGEEGSYDTNGLGTLLAEGRVPEDADLYVVLEPTHGQLQLGCIGSVTVDAIFEGQAAHAARPWLGRNAITRAGEWLAGMDQRKASPVEVEGLTFRETFQVTMALGGTAQNVVPDEFRCRVNHRFSPHRTLDEATARLQTVCDAADRVEVVDGAPPARPAVDNTLVQAMRDEMRLTVHPKQAWTDVGRLSARGWDAVNYGPGDPTLAHQDDEWIAIGDLNRFYRKLADFLAEVPT